MPPHKIWKGIVILPLLIVRSYGTALEKSTYLLLGVASVFSHLYYTLLDKHDYFRCLLNLFQGFF